MFTEMKIPSKMFNQTRFTALQIGRGLGLSKRSVHSALATVPPSGVVRVNGQVANGWSLPDMPIDWQSRLEAEAERQGYRNAEHLLSTFDQWEPPVPLAHLANEALEKALKLQKALRSSLGRLSDLSLDKAELEKLGVQDYAQEFGHEISERHWRRILKRTLERAGSQANFSRLELYLDENPARKLRAGGQPTSAGTDFAGLLDWMSLFKNPLKPTGDEEASLWNKAFEFYRAETEAGRARKKVKKVLLDFLWQRAPWLARTESALRVSFSRKLERWESASGDPAALRDKREAPKAESRAPEHQQEDIDRLIWHIVKNCGGRTSQGVREKREEGKRSGLSPDMVHYLTEHTGSSKTYVPQSLRDRLAPEVKMLEAHVQGPRAVALDKASLVRDYSGVYSKQCYQADDFTLPVYFYVPDEKGWYRLTRGQCLIMIDVRSLRILNFSLQPDRNYNSGVIRTLCTRTFGEYGLPQILYFEKGIWKTSKLVKGSGEGKWLEDMKGSPYSWPEVEMGLQEFGVKFIHAQVPRSKNVERVGGLIQDLMERYPGYCGRNESKDCPEATKKAMAEVQGKKAHPSKHFMSFDEWIAELQRVFEKYNCAQQEGRLLDGLSPDQAFEKYLNPEDPPIAMGAEIRPLLAHHKMVVPVKQDGIKFKKLGQEFIYRGEAIGHLRFQKVLAWWNPEAPETITVTTLDRKNPITLERYNGTAALSPDPEAFAADLAQVEGFARYAKARYVTLKAKFAQPFRTVIPNREYKQNVELCQKIEAQQAEIKAGHRIEQVKERSLERQAQKLGLPTQIINRGSTLATESLDLMEEARREHQREQETGETQ
jgi:hypothetical protein